MSNDHERETRLARILEAQASEADADYAAARIVHIQWSSTRVLHGAEDIPDNLWVPDAKTGTLELMREINLRGGIGKQVIIEGDAWH
ncbi:MAG: hypothetical protein WCA56_07670 [Xanthobacteraceae bacterium]